MLLTGFGNGGIMGSLIEEWRVCWMVFREIKKTETGLLKMYENVGFKIVDENDEEYIMVCEL